MDPHNKTELTTIVHETKLEKNRIKDDIKEFQNQISTISLEEKKTEFQNYIQRKLDRINIRTNIISFKYSGYKLYFDIVNISIIVISALLTFIETVKAEFELEDTEHKHLNNFFSIIPIIISSTITISAAVLKFKKYQEKMESLSRCIDKAIFTSFRLKRIKEQARHVVSEEGMKKIIDNYIKEPHDLYLKCQEEMEKNLKYEELVKHMKTYYDLSIKYELEEAEFCAKRRSITHKEHMHKKQFESEQIEEDDDDDDDSIQSLIEVKTNSP